MSSPPRLLLVAMGLLAGCTFGGDGRDFRNENDRLRRRNLELQEKVEALETRLRGQQAEIERLRHTLRGPAPTVEGVQAGDVPRMSRIELGRMSGLAGADRAGPAEELRLYLRPIDQAGRFIPVAGRALVQLITLPEQAPPREIARRAYGPGELDEAYRSGLAGTHYTLKVPLEELDLPGESLTVKLTLTDGATGHRAETQTLIRLPPASR